MTQIAPKYDSAHSQEECAYCGAGIRPGRDRVIIGTGTAFIAAYHALCWEIFQAGLETKDPSPAAEPGKGNPSY